MQTIKYLIALILTLALTFPMRANDSIPSSKVKRLSVFTMGTGFMIAGAVSNATFGNWNITQKFNHGSNAADVIQYAPFAFPWAMKAFGFSTRSGWGRMATSQGLSTIIMGGTVSLMKDNISSMRPDGSDMRSFPSGHSAWAYMGATMVAYELGWKSPWYTLGAYSVASTIAMQRIIDRRHLSKDVIAGAGIGILATQAGYILGDLIWGNKQLDNHFENIKTPNQNTHSLSLINAYSISLNKLCFDDFTISISPGFDAGLKWHTPIYENLSLASTISFQSSPLFIEKDNSNTNTYIAPLNRLRINVAPCYNIIVNEIFSIGMTAGCTYNHTFSLKSHDNSIKAEKNSIGGMVNIITSMRLTDNFSIGANIGYEISKYKFHLTPSSVYGIDKTHTTTNNINALNIGFLGSVAF